MKTHILPSAFKTICCLSLSLIAGMTLQAQAQGGIDPIEQTRQMARGINVIGYDPLWQDFGKAHFKEYHFKKIKEAGFQTLRVNLQAFGHMNGDNQLDPAWLKTLDWVVQNALTNKLTVILDEHDFNAMGKNADAGKPKLLAFWSQISERYKNAPDSVIFEILNEPNGKLDDQSWNALFKEALAIIRKNNPTRNVIIGPSSWNSIHNLSKLELPSADRHIIVTVHYYLPMNFTHQGAPWVESTSKLSGITWGTDEERQRMEKDFAGVQKWARENNRPIFLGEFGAYDKADMTSRARYIGHAARTAESLGWAWAYWQFDGDFILYDMKKDDWVQPIRDALIPR